MTKKQKKISATARLADALAGRIYIPGCDSEGFLSSNFCRRMGRSDLPSSNRRASAGRQPGVRRGTGGGSPEGFSQPKFILKTSLILT